MNENEIIKPRSLKIEPIIRETKATSHITNSLLDQKIYNYTNCALLPIKNDLNDLYEKDNDILDKIDSIFNTFNSVNYQALQLNIESSKELIHKKEIYELKENVLNLVNIEIFLDESQNWNFEEENTLMIKLRKNKETVVNLTDISKVYKLKLNIVIFNSKTFQKFKKPWKFIINNSFSLDTSLYLNQKDFFKSQDEKLEFFCVQDNLVSFKFPFNEKNKNAHENYIEKISFNLEILKAFKEQKARLIGLERVLAN